MKNIMIKTAIASAIVAATTVTTIADVKVYGRVRLLVQSTDIDGGSDTVDLRNNSSRFGVSASSKISDGLTAFGKYEFLVNADKGQIVSSAGQRLSYVGLKGGFGEISLGTRWSPYYLSTVSYNDPTNGFGGTWDSSAGFNTDFRNTDTINYKNKFGAAAIAIQVQIDGDSALDNDVDEVSIGADFKVGGATIGLGYLGTNDVADVFGLHARGKLGPVSLAGHYSNRSEDGVGQDNDAFNIVASYGLGGGKKITGTYGVTNNDAGADPTEFALEYNHNLGAGMQWFAGFSIFDADGGVGLTGDNVADTDRFGVGLRYDF